MIFKSYVHKYVIDPICFLFAKNLDDLFLVRLSYLIKHYFVIINWLIGWSKRWSSLEFVFGINWIIIRKLLGFFVKLLYIF